MKRTALILLLVYPLLASSQSTSVATAFKSNLRKAEELYGDMAYRNALEIYLHIAEKDTGNYVARQRVADCYYRIGNLDAAEEWYARLANSPSSGAISRYEYAQVLSMQGKYTEAQEWYRKYLKLVPTDLRAQSKLDFIDHLGDYYRDSVRYKIESLPFNSDQSDFGAQYHNDSIVFVSARDSYHFVKRRALSAIDERESMLDVFIAPLTTTSDEDAIPFKKGGLNSPFHDGPITFFDQGRQFAFTRSNLVDGKPVTGRLGKIRVNLYFGNLQGNNPDSIESFPYNDDSYSVGQAWVSERGNLLYFASDMPGGIGGTDIYMSDKRNGKWSKPRNLGPMINTKGDEFFPYQFNDTTFYFASNGHGGFGGLDIYVVTRRDTVFSRPENPGYPINTSKDDFGLVMSSNGRKGMLSSNREGGPGNDDLYRFTKNLFFVTGRVVDSADSTRTIPGAVIQILDSDSKLIATVRSDERGRFQMDLPLNTEFNFTASKPGYSRIDRLHYTTPATTMVREGVAVRMPKLSLFVTGSIYSKETQWHLQGANVKLLNRVDGTVDSVATDSTGVYFFQVAPGKTYEIQASKAGFLPNGFALNTTGMVEGDLVNDILLEEEFAMKAMLLFDFGKTRQNNANWGDLDPLLLALKRLPASSININVHADSTGTPGHRQDLANRRAKRAVEYFISKGIDKSRIQAKGFGEELHLKECSKGVTCQPKDRTMYRQAEVKVQQK